MQVFHVQPAWDRYLQKTTFCWKTDALIFLPFFFFLCEDLVAIMIFHPIKISLSTSPPRPAMSKTFIRLSIYYMKAATFFCQSDNLYYGNKQDLDVTFTEFETCVLVLFELMEF